MPIQIGTKTHNFSDPTGLLSDCHRRIEMFLTALEAVATVIDRPASEETRRALESALRYFSEAAPKHIADEEVSLFPRLRQIQNAEIQSSFSQLEKLEEEHRWAATLHSEVESLGRQYLLTNCLSGIEVEKFRNAVTCLAFMYKRHIQFEDSVVFPLATRLLHHAEKMAIAEEMTRRRGVKLITEIDL
jgi:hemerythrin-like domain-containing protein